MDVIKFPHEPPPPPPPLLSRFFLETGIANRYHRSSSCSCLTRSYVPSHLHPVCFVQESREEEAQALKIDEMRRRFINLVRRCHETNSFNLHLIRSSTLFYPKNRNGCTKPPPPPPTQVEEARLPKPALSLRTLPSEEYCMDGSWMFMSFGSGMDRALSLDPNGNVLTYDPRLNAICSMPMMPGCKPRLHKGWIPKAEHIAFNVDDGLYLLNMYPTGKFEGNDRPCFHVLKHGHPDVYEVPRWHWRSLPPPPYVDAPGHKPAISASAVVGDAIWVSAPGVGTYAFDTVTRAWSKAGGWELPFRGAAEHVPELGLWFGFSPEHKKPFCAWDLSAAAAGASRSRRAPKLRHVWRDELAGNGKDWDLLDYLLVHLGNGRFCVARFYYVFGDDEDRKGVVVPKEKFAVFTGVEVERCHKKADGGIQMVKHRSLRYEIDGLVSNWLL